MDWLASYGPSLLWLLALVVFLLVEALTVGLTSIWFAAGALAALIMSFVVQSLWFEVLTFLVVSFLALLCVRPMVSRFMVPKQQATNADRVIGEEAVVLEAIDNLSARGQAVVSSVVWTARSENGALIAKDTRVRILRIEGVKLIVVPIEKDGTEEIEEE